LPTSGSTRASASNENGLRIADLGLRIAERDRCVSSCGWKFERVTD
jgi:hypothetical protein